MSDIKDKEKHIHRAIKAIGGKANGTGETWVFTTRQIKKLIWSVGLAISFVLFFSTQINIFKEIPFRMNVIESSQVQMQKECMMRDNRIEMNGQNIAHIKEDTKAIREDMRLIKGVLLRNK